MTDRSIVLVGPPAAGKTSTGRRLARMLSMPFIDIDERIATEYGSSISEIFQTKGEEEFRRMECEMTITCLRRNSVVALGGGAITNEQIRQAIAPHITVLLTVSVEEAVMRVGDAHTRPLLQGDVAHNWIELVDKRHALYEQVADITISTTDKNLKQVAKQIIAAIEKDHDAS